LYPKIRSFKLDHGRMRAFRRIEFMPFKVNDLLKLAILTGLLYFAGVRPFTENWAAYPFDYYLKLTTVLVTLAIVQYFDRRTTDHEMLLYLVGIFVSLVEGLSHIQVAVSSTIDGTATLTTLNTIGIQGIALVLIPSAMIVHMLIVQPVLRKRQLEARSATKPAEEETQPARIVRPEFARELPTVDPLMTIVSRARGWDTSEKAKKAFKKRFIQPISKDRGLTEDEVISHLAEVVEEQGWRGNPNELARLLAEWLEATGA
jgi:hypothetical protein